MKMKIVIVHLGMKQVAGFMAKSFIHLRMNIVFGVYLKILLEK